MVTMEYLKEIMTPEELDNVDFIDDAGVVHMKRNVEFKACVDHSDMDWIIPDDIHNQK